MTPISFHGVTKPGKLRISSKVNLETLQLDKEKTSAKQEMYCTFLILIYYTLPWTSKHTVRKTILLNFGKIILLVIATSIN